MTALALAVSGRGLVDPTAPVLSVEDDGFARGRAAFETLRVYRGRPFRLREHLERLGGSARSIGLPAPDLEAVETLADLALGAAGAPDVTLKLYWTPGVPGGDPMAFALVSSLPEWIEETRARGLRLVSVLAPRRNEPWLLPGTKSVSYALNMAAEQEAKARGADDALLVDPDGVVLEGPVTNVWWREGSLLLTPSLELGILAGVTRAALIELAHGVGYGVEEGAYHLERVARADEAFTSSSVREVMPVVELDRRRLSRGPAGDELQAALRRLAENG